MKTNLSILLLSALCIFGTNLVSAQTITTVAGTSITGYIGEGIATAVGLDRPCAVVVDGIGNIFIADRDDQRIRKVTPAGIISTYAGTGTFGYNGDGILATTAQIFDPNGLALDASGNLYFADLTNNRIRKISTAGIITTIAGTGTAGYNGDGIVATTAQLNNPKGVAVDGGGNVYIADYRNGRIRKVTPGGIISTIAGDGTFGVGADEIAATSTQLFFPSSVLVNGGNVYITDENNQRVRRIDAAGIIHNFAGNGTFGSGGNGGQATAAQLFDPSGLAMDAFGNMYIAEYTNHHIRKVTPAGIISTFAGTTASAGFSGDGGPASAAVFNRPTGVAVDAAGNVFIADQLNDRIRKVNTLPPITGNLSICIAGTTTLSNALGGGSWTSGNPAVAIVGSSSGTVIGFTSGTSVITYHFGIETTTATVTVNPLPAAGSISGPANVCIGTPITYSDASPAGVWSSDNTAIASVSGGGVVSGITTGTFTLSYTVTNACGAASTSRVITVGSLSAGTITGPSSVCTGSTVQLTDAVSGGVWSVSNTNISITSSGLVSGLSVGTATVSYAITGSCGTATATFPITVNTTPVPAAISGPSNVCISLSVNLSDASIGGVWSNTNTSTTVSTGGVVTGVAAGIDTISYTLSNTCGTATVTHTVTVDPLPNAGVISGSSNVCIGSSVPFTETVTGGVWSTSNTNAFVTTGGLVIGLVAGNDTVIYTVTGACGSATSIHSVTVNPLAAPGPITGSSNVCVGSSIALTDLSGGGVWSTSNTSATVSSGGLVTGMAAGVDTIYYTVTNVCGPVSAEKTVTVSLSSGAGIINGASSVCIGSRITMTDAVTGGSWSVSNTNISVSSFGRVTGLVLGTATVSYTVTTGCGIASATKAITVNPVPTVGTTAGSPAALCLGSAMHFSNTTPGGVWSCSDTFKAKITSTGTATGFGLGADTIKYTITDPKGCTATAKFPLTIANVFPSAVVLPSGTAPLCNNTPVVIYVVASTASGYQWLSGSTPIPGATAVSYTAKTAGTYNLELTASGCVATFPGTTVLPKIIPTVTFTPPNTLSTGAFTTYEWYKDGHFIPGATAATLTVTEGGSYKVVVMDANKCNDTSAVYKFAGISGVRQIANEDGIRIFPNPATSTVIIDAPVPVTASVMSMDGKVLVTKQQAKEINISALANGIYMILLHNEHRQLLKAAKFIKEDK